METKTLAQPAVNTNQSGLKICANHKKVSKAVTLKNLDVIKSLYFPMRLLMENMEKNGIFKDVYALAHSQIEAKRPLRFFVLNLSNSGLKMELEKYNFPDDLVLNPEIFDHVKTESEKSEGCLSFVGMPNATVNRWQKIRVRFQTIDHEGNQLISHELNCSGKLAQIFQHEIDHMDAKYIWLGKI